MKRNKYPPKKLVYIVRPQETDKKLIKVGKTTDFKTRSHVINNSLPDHAEVLYYIETNHIEELESMVKQIMKRRGYSYLGKKEYFKVSVPIAKIIYDTCYVNILKKYDELPNFDDNPELKQINDNINYNIKCAKIKADRKMKRLVQMYDTCDEIDIEIERQGLLETEKLYANIHDNEILFNDDQVGGNTNNSDGDFYDEYNYDSDGHDYDDLHSNDTTNYNSTLDEILENYIKNKINGMNKTESDNFINKIFNLLTCKYRYLKYYAKYLECKNELKNYNISSPH